MDAAAAKIARVEPLTRTRAVRGPFDYVLSSDQQRSVAVGSLLRVSFGGRRMLGIVTELVQHSELSPERLIEPEAILPGALPADLVALAHWMAAEYCSTPARALTLLLPAGAVDGVRPKQVLTAARTDAGLKALTETDGLTERQRAVLTALEEHGELPAVELGTAALRRLEKRGLVVLDQRERRRRPQHTSVGARRQAPPRLTAAQRAALDRVLAALASPPGQRAGGRFLLHGVTGSGKTEVYLCAVEAALAAGLGAIVLVPEIGLTPQALGRFEERFGDIVAVLHSGLSQGERFDEWRRLRRGEARVCVGPRSAVFAPLEQIGLVVIDEEHDSSYKHEGDPRYDARAVALQRALQHDAVVLAGSATPRPESVATLERLVLAERVDGLTLPPVEVLDMRAVNHPLHPHTRMALADVRRSNSKAIVLLNRRGWSNFLSCRSCGHVWSCPNCEVTLVLHRREELIACHHCGHRQPLPARCDQCGSTALARHGAGTERLEDELRSALGGPGFPVFRLDADAAAAKNGAAQTLAAFEAADAGVLVGTQMVAKGHDFPDVTLGVVLDADQTLRFPDFRAEERTFSLITQLAGRAGRGEAGGRVLVQTLAPGARAIAFAARHDADGFLEEELRRRRLLEYPPFASLIRIVCSATDARAAQEAAQHLRDRIAPPASTVLGPAPLFRLRGLERSQLVLKAHRREAAIAAVRAAVEQFAIAAGRRGVKISVDVDPQ